MQATATNTTITVKINDGAVSFTGTTSTLFDPSNGRLNLTLISSNFNENYLINSVTFTRGLSPATAVAEPEAFAGLGLGLTTLSLSLYRRRKPLT